MPGAGTTGPRRRRTGRGPAGLLRRGSGVVAGAVAAVCVPALGALVPALPGAGILGTYLEGLYAVPLLCISVVLGALTVRLVRRGGVAARLTLGTAALAVCAQGVVVGADVRAAHRAGAVVSWWQAAVRLGQPDVRPDATVAFAHGGGQESLMDVYLPPRRKGRAAPAVVWAHGGGFTGGRRTDRRGTFRWLARHGYVVFAAGYRLASATGPPGWNRQPQDVVCALAWVRAHARRFGVDPALVALGGESAGGTLALDAAYRLTEGSVSAESPGRGGCGPTPRPPAAVAAFYPAVDLTRAWREDLLGSRRNLRALLGGPPDRFPARYRALSPSAHLSSRVPPTLLVTGSHDHLVGMEQSVRLHRRLRVLGAASALTVVPFSDHAFDLAYGSLGAQAGRSALLSFLRGRLPPGG